MPGQPVTFEDPELYARAVAGRIFSAQTAVTGVAPGTAIGTTGAFTLYNQPLSGVDLVILEARMAYVSGTLGAGVVNYLKNNPGVAAPTGTAIVIENGRIGGATSAKALAFTTSTIVAPTLLRPFASLQASLASTAVAPWQVADKVNGGIIVPPGGQLHLHATAAGGSSPLVVFYMQWSERATVDDDD